MAPWFAVVIPALVVALVVRLDGLLIGPYFSIASVVAGMVGFDDRYFNAPSTLRFALIRRFFYPFILGIALALAGVGFGDTVAAGLIAAGLLLWPAVFHPLPKFVSLRDWQVLTVWTTFFLAYGGLGAIGWFAVEIVYSAAGGDVAAYLLGLVRDSVLTTIGTIFLLAFFKGSFESLRAKVQGRESSGDL